MTRTEKLRRWRRAKKRLNLKCKQIAILLEPNVTPQTVFNWNCGAQAIPDSRVKELEAMR